MTVNGDRKAGAEHTGTAQRPRRRRRVVLLFLAAAMLTGVGWFGLAGGSRGRASRLVVLADSAESIGWLGGAAHLYDAATAVGPNAGFGIVVQLEKSQMYGSAGQYDKAARIAWQVARRHCASPPASTDGDVWCFTALDLALYWEALSAGREESLGLEDATRRLRRTAERDPSEDVRAMASFELAGESKLAAGVPRMRAVADAYAAVARDFPDSDYWASKALRRAAALHERIGERELAQREREMLLERYPDTPAAQAVKQKLRTGDERQRR